MTSPSDLYPNSVKISTQTLGETIYQFVDLPGFPSIQERIIRTQEDQVKKALADLGWICPQEAKAMRGDIAAKDTEIANLKRGPTPDFTGDGSAWVPPKAQEIQAGPGPRPSVCPSPAPPPKHIDGPTLVAYRSALALAEWASENPIDDAWRASFADVQRHFYTPRANLGRA